MIVVDTNVVSELVRPSLSPLVRDWVNAQAPGELCTTAVTVAEIRYGLERLPDGRRKDSLLATATDVFTAFREFIQPFDADAAVCYATIVARRDRLGLPIDGFDAQLAAICRTRGAAPATRLPGNRNRPDRSMAGRPRSRSRTVIDSPKGSRASSRLRAPLPYGQGFEKPMSYRGPMTHDQPAGRAAAARHSAGLDARPPTRTRRMRVPASRVRTGLAVPQPGVPPAFRADLS